MGKELIGITNNLSDAVRKAQVVGRITPQGHTQNLPVIDPGDRPNPEPSTADSPEDRRVQLSNCFQLDTRRVGEEAPKEL